MSAYTGELTAEDHMKERAPVSEPDRLGRHHLPGAIAAGIRLLNGPVSPRSLL